MNYAVFTNLDEALSIAQEIHAVLGGYVLTPAETDPETGEILVPEVRVPGRLPGYSAAKWADPIPHPNNDGTENDRWLLPWDPIRADFVGLTPEEQARFSEFDTSGRLLTREEAEAAGWFPASPEE